MIFCTIGNDTHEFTRFSDLVLKYACDHPDKTFIFQHGHTSVTTDLANVQLCQFISRFDFVKNLEDCEAIFCHAGAGTLGTSKSLGKIPLVLPRLKIYNEHVDNHQLDIFSAYLEHRWIVKLDDYDCNVDYTHTNTSPVSNQLIRSLKEKIDQYARPRNL